MCIKDKSLAYKINVPVFVALRIEKRALIISRQNKTFSIFVNRNFLISLDKKKRIFYIRIQSECLKFSALFLKDFLHEFKGLIKKIGESFFCLLKESKTLVFLVGLGFRLELSKHNRAILLKLGLSHYIKVLTPLGIQVFSPKENILLLKSSSQEKLHNFVHLLQNCKRPDVYKNKGVFLNWQSLQIKKIKKIG